MYITYIVRRTQIYLEEDQDARLERRAKEDGVTKSSLIRAAIDTYLQGPEERARSLARWQAVLDEVAGIAPYLPPGKEYVEELRKADRRRQEELDREHWRR
jgi:ribbon-helix-helix CopG family protein